MKISTPDLDATLPERSIGIVTDQGELLICSAEWVDCVDDLSAHVLGWLMAHIDLRAATTRTGARRYDEVWMTAWRQANPGGPGILIAREPDWLAVRARCWRTT